MNESENGQLGLDWWQDECGTVAAFSSPGDPRRFCQTHKRPKESSSSLLLARLELIDAKVYEP